MVSVWYSNIWFRSKHYNNRISIHEWNSFTFVNNNTMYSSNQEVWAWYWFTVNVWYNSKRVSIQWTMLFFYFNRCCQQMKIYPIKALIHLWNFTLLSQIIVKHEKCWKTLVFNDSQLSISSQGKYLLYYCMSLNWLWNLCCIVIAVV